MSKITPVGSKKRKIEEAMRGKTAKPRKRIRKQKRYHSSSEDDSEPETGFKPVNLADSDDEAPQPIKQKKVKKSKTTEKPQSILKAPTQEFEDDETSGGEEAPPPVKKSKSKKTAVQDQSSASEEESADDDNDSSASEPDSDADPNVQPTKKPKSKRNDPDAFSTSISKILSTKLSSTQRSDPVLSRSLDATRTSQEKSATRLEAKARAKLRAEKLAALNKNRTTDVLGIERGITGEVAEKEKQLRKIATRGVIQLFNAFRGAHERAEEARKEERRKGTVGIGERDRVVAEKGKEEFLELIGGRKKQAV